MISLTSQIVSDGETYLSTSHKFERFRTVVPILLRFLEERNDKDSKLLLQKCVKSSASDTLKAIVALKTLVVHIKTTVISVNKKSFKPTKADIQQGFYTILKVCNIYTSGQAGGLKS